MPLRRRQRQFSGERMTVLTDADDRSLTAYMAMRGSMIVEIIVFDRNATLISHQALGKVGLRVKAGLLRALGQFRNLQRSTERNVPGWEKLITDRKFDFPSILV